jgi:hypothetical protein
VQQTLQAAVHFTTIHCRHSAKSAHHKNVQAKYFTQAFSLHILTFFKTICPSNRRTRSALSKSIKHFTSCFVIFALSGMKVIVLHGHSQKKTKEMLQYFSDSNGALT